MPGSFRSGPGLFCAERIPGLATVHLPANQFFERMNRILTLLLAFGLMSGPTFGQAANDAAPTSAEYTFRFVAYKDMFYVPWSGTGEELERLLT